MSEGYLNPIAVVYYGRHLSHILKSCPSVDDHESLVGIAYNRNGQTAIAPILTNSRLYAELWRQHLIGKNYLHVELYAFPNSQLQKARDAGRVLVSQIEAVTRSQLPAQQSSRSDFGVSLTIPSDALKRLNLS